MEADRLLLKSRLDPADEMAEQQTALNIYRMAEEYGFTELVEARKNLMKYQGSKHAVGPESAPEGQDLEPPPPPESPVAAPMPGTTEYFGPESPKLEILRAEREEQWRRLAELDARLKSREPPRPKTDGVKAKMSELKRQVANLERQKAMMEEQRRELAEIKARLQSGESPRPKIPQEKVRYYTRIRDIITAQWVAPTAELEALGPAVIRITIAPEGEISDIELKRSSGLKSFDDSTLAAIKASTPLPPLPPVFDQEPTTIGLSFNQDDMSREARQRKKAPPKIVGVTAYDLKFSEGTVSLKIKVLAPNQVVEGIRLDNVGGRSSLWRSDGVQAEAGPIKVSRAGDSLTDGSRPRP